MNHWAWMYFDPRGMGITLSLSAALLALALLICLHALGRQLPGMRWAATGLVLSALGYALNMLQHWTLPALGLVLAIVCMVGGVALLLRGVRLLRRLPTGWGIPLGSTAAGLVLALQFGLWAPHARWRIGLLSLLLAWLATQVAHTTWAEARSEHQRGMRLISVLGMVFALLMGLRALAAALGPVPSSVYPTPINAAMVLVSGMALIGAVLGLVLVLSGELLAQLEHQRQHDPLSGLLNRQGLRQWIAALPAGQAMAIGMLDLDHFKNINDQHGHALGDQVIRHLAALLRSCESTNCHTARLGGEEFVVIALGDKQSHALQSTLDAVRTQFAGSGPLPGSTLSAGIASGHIGAFEATLRAADAALYQAKQAGRNRITLSAA